MALVRVAMAPVLLPLDNTPCKAAPSSRSEGVPSLNWQESCELAETCLAPPHLALSGDWPAWSETSPHQPP
eukprot:CAMPEP_0115864720 /NCGR_PEP_ID=MMETSP0287-20121206/19346_1 /TAXON_ID=412157 /ORGANISM="Chrysochromulina rotalis, Strain UIO044" /LENGTH=70 /DNA_ID=CAMNT_0003319199 /DNA_START=482 /DNA_END=690 /DNA_ORIENTATION=-